MQSRSAFYLSSLLFPALSGGGELPHPVIPGSVIGHDLSAHPLPNFPVSRCSLLPLAQREVVLYWMLKKREGKVTGIEAVLHVGHFLFIA